MLTYGQDLYRRRKQLRETPEYLADYGESVQVVPERLTRARLEACFSIEELADQVSCSHWYLSQAEWDGGIGAIALAQVAEACGKELAYFSQPWPPKRPVEFGDVSEWVRNLRESQGYSLREWQEETGIDRTQWAHWESGRKPPLPRSFRRILDNVPGATWPPDGKVT